MRRMHGTRAIVTAMLGAIVAGAAGCGSIQWETSYDRAMRRGIEQRRRVLVQFASTVSTDCREMDLKVFTDSEVQRLTKNFVPVRLDTVLDKKLADHLGVSVVPSFYVIRPDGQVVGSHAGKMDAEKFRIFLIKYSYN